MNKTLGKFLLAVVTYTGFAVYLYKPYFKGFGQLQLQDLFLINCLAAAIGCFVVSRRWVASFWGSLFAGAIYGFGPFSLSVAAPQPAAGPLLAAIPWLFCPAVFGPGAKWRWLRVLLAAIPFCAILLFSQLSARLHLFVIPIQTKLHAADLSGLLAPLVMVERGANVVGFYHVPIAALIMGFAMLLAARRYGVIAIFIIGTLLAFCGPILEVSSILWLTLPVLCCSVLVGVGLQALASATWADRKWVGAVAIIMAVLSVVTLLLATNYFQIFAGLGAKYARLLVTTAKMYILGTLAVTIVFFMSRARLRISWLRLVLLCAAIAVDIFFGARFIVDRIF